MFAKIITDPEGAESVLTIIKEEGIRLCLESITEALDAEGICFGIDTVAIRALIQEQEQVENTPENTSENNEETEGAEDTEGLPESYIIAKAKMPRAGKSGTVEFKVDAERSYHADAKSDKVDYRESMQVESVQQGQILAEIHPPSEGTAGTSVFGKVLPARDGRPAQIKPGKNVELRGTTLVAVIEGVINKVGNVIAVSPVFEVSGGLTMEVGNIDFTGTVIIGGDVDDDFTVKAGGDIQISGSVGKATLISGGNITINGGFNGKDKGLIAAEGSVEIKYISHGNVRANENVEVKKEINNSTVYTLGRIEIPRGTILGGTVMALHGIAAEALGSELGVKTTIILGTHYKLADLEEKFQKCNETFAEIERKITPYIDNSAKFDALPDERKKEMLNLRTLSADTRTAWIEIQKKMKPYLEEAKERSPEVIISKVLHTDVVLKTKNCLRTTNEELLGPLKATEDIENSTMQVGKVE